MRRTPAFIGGDGRPVPPQRQHHPPRWVSNGARLFLEADLTFSRLEDLQRQKIKASGAFLCDVIMVCEQQWWIKETLRRVLGTRWRPPQITAAPPPALYL